MFRVFSGIGVVLIALFLLASLLAPLSLDDTSFSITARSDVLHVELPCGDRLEWDLPPGKILRAPDSREVLSSELVSMSLRGGVHVRLWTDGERHLNALVGSADAYNCPNTDLDRATAILDQGEFILGASQWTYRSKEPLESPSRLLLVVTGRVRIGEQIAQGAGLINSAQPILEQASIDARTPDPQTDQKRFIHAESIEAGSLVDTHACLDSPPSRVVACVKEASSKVDGFIRVNSDGENGFLEIQAFVVGKSIGVRQFGGIERKIVVTWWSRWVTSSLLQIFAALVLGMSVVASFTSLFSSGSAASIEKRQIK